MLAQFQGAHVHHDLLGMFVGRHSTFELAVTKSRTPPWSLTPTGVPTISMWIWTRWSVGATS